MRMYQIDAFSDRVFAGNPAAVCPLNSWLPDEVMQAIATENNLAETAFFAPEGDDFRLRWFTPVAEVDLCGHATLASADVLFRILGYDRPAARFHTRSGVLTVSRHEDAYSMDFPATVPTPCAADPRLAECLGAAPAETLRAFDHVVVLDSEATVRRLSPDFSRMSAPDLRGVVVTAPGTDADYVARCFYPKLGVNEDPVTGSAHCEIAPYWAHRLGRHALRAEQLSSRGGVIWCDVQGDRVTLRGRAAHYMTADITVPSMAMPAPGYVVADIAVHDVEAYGPYVSAAPPIIAKYGGRYLVRGGPAQAVEGAPPNRTVVLEFPSAEAAHAWYNSPEYQAIAGIRQRTATSRVFIVEGMR